MKYLLILLTLVIVSCNIKHTSEPQTETKSPFSIKYGQVKYLQPLGVYVGFRDVKEDSRCPDGGVCVWEGRAMVHLWIKSPSADTIYIDAPLYGRTAKDDTKGHRIVDTLGYKLSVYQLDPYPHVSVPQIKERYVALVDLSASR